MKKIAKLIFKHHLKKNKSVVDSAINSIAQVLNENAQLYQDYEELKFKYEKLKELCKSE